MMRQNEHGRLIAAAAKAHLLPLGCRRRGQSRFWSADQGFWQIGIEFQPSGWSRGSYLNVGGQWLWRPVPHFTFDTGHRVANFVPFVSVEQFAPEADRLAALAADEVRALRAKFRSWPDIARFLAMPPHHHAPWTTCNRAIAAGLTGNLPGARHLFGQVLMEPVSDSWSQRRHAIAGQLASCLDDVAVYRGTVAALVDECRALQRLAPDPDCFYGMKWDVV